MAGQFTPIPTYGQRSLVDIPTKPGLHLHPFLSSSTPMIPSTAAFTAAISSSMVELPKTALHPTYAGFPVLLARILATLVAQSILPGTAYRGVLKGSEG